MKGNDGKKRKEKEGTRDVKKGKRQKERKKQTNKKENNIINDS